MKLATPFFLMISSACTYNFTPVPAVNQEIQVSNQFDPESAAGLYKRLNGCEIGKWNLDLQKVRNSYTAVLPVLDDERIVLFSVAMFKTLSMNEELDLAADWLPHLKDSLPNTKALKFFYEAEKQLNMMIALIREFIDSSQEEVKQSAMEAVKYFQFKKDCFSAIRDVDYRRLNKRDVPMDIPPEVLRANAKMLEQRDEMVLLLTRLYNSFPRTAALADLPKPTE